MRGTVRSRTREKEIRTLLEKHGAAAHNFEVVQAELTKDEGWDEAVTGCTQVLHMASPLPIAPPKDENELIVPARDGVLRVLRAASKAKVTRVVLTSSVAAVVYGHARDGSRTYDESDWSELGPGVGAYEKSKTIAERAAWDFVEGQPEGERIELVALNPGLVLGPLLGPEMSTSGEVVRKLLKRELPGCPDIGWAVVDVRDVADAHVAAMRAHEAAGKRFILAIGHASMLDIAKILKANGYDVPTRRVPGWLLRLVSVWDKTAALAVQELGKRQDVTSQRARDLLGWNPRTLEDMVVSMAESMVAEHVV